MEAVWPHVNAASIGAFEAEHAHADNGKRNCRERSKARRCASKERRAIGKLRYHSKREATNEPYGNDKPKATGKPPCQDAGVAVQEVGHYAPSHSTSEKNARYKRGEYNCGNGGDG